MNNQNSVSRKMNNARQIAREIISEVCANTPGDEDCDFEREVNERYPTGKGVGIAHARMRREVLAEIDAFYAPRDAAEPDVDSAVRY